MAAARTFAFSPAMGMIYRIHHHTPYFWASANPPLTARFTYGNMAVVRVGKLSNGGLALGEHHPYFTRGKLEQCVSAFFGHKLGVRSGPSSQLAAFADLHFNIMNECP
jgi:hypothetical protein